jgi:purine-binding chemotaxis protein CheW
MIGVLVDDVLAVSTYTHEEIDRDTHASQKSDRDILGIIRKKTKTSDREKNDLIIWLDIRTMIRRVEQDL